MNPTRFDTIARLVAERRLSRRQALATGGATLAAAGLLTSRRTSAQDATPAPFPSDPHPSADTATTHPEFLFTQTFDAGTWAPKPGEDGVFVLTLTGTAAQTTYFSDRPERVVGLAPTQQFLDGLGFTPVNPPNAALVTQTEQGDQDVLVIELFAPAYDANAGTLTYDAKVLADYGERGLAYLAQQQTDYELAASFGEGSLFIDDCPNYSLCCTFGIAPQGPIPGGAIGTCYNDVTICQPCSGLPFSDYEDQCNSTYPNCGGSCLLC